MKGGVLDRLAMRLLPPLVGIVARMLFTTCRVTIHGEEHRQHILEQGKPVVVSFWHYSVFGAFPLLYKYKGVVMVSSSRDGEYIARLASQFGMKAVRGSRNNHGVKALKALIREVKKGLPAGIVADGSQGPARVAQPGALLAASMAGVPVMPVAWSASRYWSIRSWDKTSFPKPFSRVEFVFGEPITIPPGIRGEEVEKYRVLLEQSLNRLYSDMWRLQGKEEH